MKYTVISHQGLVRSSNEDIIEAFVYNKMDTTGAALRLQGLLVCDGMGGMKAGETASKLATLSVLDYIKAMPFWPSLESDINQQLSDAIISAHQNIIMLSEYDYDKSGMGTTIVLLLIVKNQAHILWCGDSRAYLLTARTISQGINTGGLQLLTRDHSASWDMVAKGILTVDQARNHPQSHALTQSLGGILPPKPDYVSLTVEDGDRFMLCTDGVYLHLDSAEIKSCLVDYSDLELAAQAMTNMILERGAKDNFSIGILDVVKVQYAEPVLKVPPLTHHQNRSKNRSHWLKWWFLLPILFAFGGLVYGIWTKFKDQKVQTETSLQPKHPLIASKENHERNQIILSEAMHSLKKEIQQLQDINDQMARYILRDTLVENMDEDMAITAVNQAIGDQQNSIKKVKNSSKNKSENQNIKKPPLNDKAQLCDNLFREIQIYMKEYKETFPNPDIFKNNILVNLEVLLYNVTNLKKSYENNDFEDFDRKLKELRNKFDMIQSKYKPE